MGGTKMDLKKHLKILVAFLIFFKQLYLSRYNSNLTQYSGLREVIHKKIGGQTTNLNFLDFILVELHNLVTEKCNPIFGLNFRGEGVKYKFVLLVECVRR